MSDCAVTVTVPRGVGRRRPVTPSVTSPPTPTLTGFPKELARHLPAPSSPAPPPPIHKKPPSQTTTSVATSQTPTTHSRRHSWSSSQRGMSSPTVPAPPPPPRKWQRAAGGAVNSVGSPVIGHRTPPPPATSTPTPCRPTRNPARDSRVVDMLIHARITSDDSIVGTKTRGLLRGLLDMVAPPGSPPPAPPARPPVNEMRGSSRALVEAIRGMQGEQWSSQRLVDYWSSRETPCEGWVGSVGVSEGVLVDLEAARVGGFGVESCWESVTHVVPELLSPYVVLRAEEEHPFFKEFLSCVEHETYVVPDLPCVVSVESPGAAGTSCCCKAIVRTKEQDLRVLLPADRATRALKALVPALREAKLVKVKEQQCPQVVQRLLKFEESSIVSSFKFGVLYVAPGQKDENEMYGNVRTSKSFQEFLSFLGDVVPLRGWGKFRGGLDVKGDNTGTHSVFTEYKNYEIMFHVAPMLPFQAADEQKLERKRHIGNDVVVLVFLDERCSGTFSPQTLTSHFIHCTFVVKPEVNSKGETTHYRLALFAKPGVPPCPPYLSSSARWPKTPDFREFLLTKMINAERVAMSSPEFSSLITARKMRLEDVCQLALAQH